MESLLYFPMFPGFVFEGRCSAIPECKESSFGSPAPLSCL